MKWAQRDDCVYLTIELPDVKDEKIGLTAEKLSFEGTSGDGRKWAGEVELFLPVKPDESTWKVGPRSIAIKLVKDLDHEKFSAFVKTQDDEKFWTRLLLDKAINKSQAKIDWDRNVDEFPDEDEKNKGGDTSTFDGGQGFGGGGGGGMPGMGGGPGGPGGGMGGMDMESLMAQMGGGMGGAGGPGGMDMAAMMKQMGGGMGGGDMGGGEGDEDDEGDDDEGGDDDDMPPLEEDAPADLEPVD